MPTGHFDVHALKRHGSSSFVFYRVEVVGRDGTHIYTQRTHEYVVATTYFYIEGLLKQ